MSPQAPLLSSRLEPSLSIYRFGADSSERGESSYYADKALNALIAMEDATKQQIENFDTDESGEV